MTYWMRYSLAATVLWLLIVPIALALYQLCLLGLVLSYGRWSILQRAGAALFAAWDWSMDLLVGVGERIDDWGRLPRRKGHA